MPERSESDRAENNRRVVLAQLSHLIDEVGALRSHVDLIPDVVLKQRPLESVPSFNEIYLLLARYDVDVYTPAIEELRDGGKAAIDVPENVRFLQDEPAPQQDITQILDDVQKARSQLLARLEEIPLDEWSRCLELDGEETDLFGLAYAIAQHDAALQQAAAYRLHESRLTSRDEDLPK